MPAAVTAMVLGAGMSIAICGSMLGNQTFDANCQTRIMNHQQQQIGQKRQNAK